tara:strand:- start:807 stop:1118 length:312 start_codon:yes stop_codon:yes gene_type:complete
MSDITRIEAIINLVGGEVSGDSEGKHVKYHDGQTPPSDSEIASKKAELEADFTAKKYQRDREVLYPELQEQFDLLFHDMTAGKGDKTGKWYKALNKVKTDNPK